MSLGSTPSWIQTNPQEWGNLAARGAQLDIERQNQAQQAEEQKASMALRRDELSLNAQQQQEQSQRQSAAEGLQLASLLSGIQQKKQQFSATEELARARLAQNGQIAQARLGFGGQKESDLQDYRTGMMQDRADLLEFNKQKSAQQAANAAQRLSEQDKMRLAELKTQYLTAFKALNDPTTDEKSKLAASQSIKDIETRVSELTSKPKAMPDVDPQPQPQPAAAALQQPSNVLPDAQPKPSQGGDELVSVINPQGKRVKIKNSQLDDALRQGYQRP